MKSRDSGQIMESSTPIYDYASCSALIDAHWQHGAMLENMAEMLKAFIDQRDLMPQAERPSYEKGVFSWPWRIPSVEADDISMSSVAAIRWLTNREEADRVCRWQEQRGGALRLSLTALNPEISGILARYPGNLELFGITSLDRESAKALADRPADKGRLCLTLGFGLHDMASMAHLEPLWSRRNSIISLPGLIKLDDEAAEILARCQGTLRFPRLVQMSGQHAQLLASGKLVRLEFESLPAEAITDEVASGLCSGQLNELSLGAVAQEIPALSTLSAYSWGILQLDGFKQLPLGLAKILQQSKIRHLKLNGLLQLDFATASALCGSNRPFRLSIDSVTKLEDKVVSILVSNKFRSLDIRKVTGLSDVAKVMLKEFGNYECPGVNS